jgi:hypothetical protein
VLWGVLLLVTVLAVVAFILWPRPTAGPARTRAATSSVESPAPLEANDPERAAPLRPSSSGLATPPASAPAPLAPLDLFGPDAPELLGMGLKVVERGGILSSARLKEIFQYGREHPGDARAFILMGADSMNRGWLGFAVDHYTRAQKEDPRARQDPRMLRDLVQVAGDEHYGARGAAALGSIYGPTAVTAVEDAIVEAGGKGDMARVARLTELSRALSSPSP